MRRTRYVALPVRAWQYVGLLVVSLACLTLGLVSRDKEGRAGSLAGPELKHQAPHEVDACPNLSPFTKMPSCSNFEQNRTRISKTTKETRNSRISLASTDLGTFRSRSLDRASRTRSQTRADLRNMMERLGGQRTNIEYDSRRTVESRHRIQDRTTRVSDSAIRLRIARSLHSRTTQDLAERRLLERSADTDTRRRVNRRVIDSRERDNLVRSMERPTSTDSRRESNQRSSNNADRRNRIQMTIRRDSGLDRDHRFFNRLEQREATTHERRHSFVTSLRRSVDNLDRERNNRQNLARERRESSLVRAFEITRNYLKERRVRGLSNDRRSERRSLVDSGRNSERRSASVEPENHAEGRADRRLVERRDNRSATERRTDRIVNQRVDRRLGEERIHRRIADQRAERRLMERRTDALFVEQRADRRRLVAERRSTSVESRIRKEARTTDSENREEARADRRLMERRTDARLTVQRADRRRLVAERRSTSVESRIRKEARTTDSQNREEARADGRLMERRTDRRLTEQRADRRRLVAERRSTSVESRIRKEARTIDQRRRERRSVSIDSENREEARADRRLMERRTDARLTEQRADRRRLVAERRSTSVESRIRKEARTTDSENREEARADGRLMERRTDARLTVQRADRRRLVAERRSTSVESRIRKEAKTTDSQNREEARADGRLMERRTDRRLTEQRADRRRLVAERRSTSVESRIRKEARTTDSENREEARADGRLMERRTDARLTEQRADRRRLVAERRSSSVESRIRGETRTDRRLVQQRTNRRIVDRKTDRRLVERRLAEQRIDRRDSNSRRSVRQTLDTDRLQRTGTMLTRLENDIRSSQKEQRFAEKARAALATSPDRSINDIGRTRSVERDIRSADRDSRSRSIQDSTVLRRRVGSQQRNARIPVDTRSLTVREKTQARGNDFIPRMKILGATDLLKQQNSVNYAFAFEIIRQALTIGLCTMYGLSIFYGKRSFIGNFARQGPQLAIW